MAKKNKTSEVNVNGVAMLEKIRNELPKGWTATNKKEAYQKELRKDGSIGCDTVWTSWCIDSKTKEKGLAVLNGKVSVIPASKFSGYTLNGHDLK